MSSPSSPSPSSNSVIPRIQPGDGRIVLEFDPYRGHTFAQLSYTYPLKLLSPGRENSVAIVYVLSYGGGLVGGDEVELDVAVGEGASLMLLSQVRSSSRLSCGRLLILACSRRVPRKCSRTGSQPALTFKDNWFNLTQPHPPQNHRVRSPVNV